VRFDLSNAAVTKLINEATKRGYVTYEQLNAVMPLEEVTSEQIEDILAMLNEMGINVVETEEAEADEEARERPESEETESGELIAVTPIFGSRVSCSKAPPHFSQIGSRVGSIVDGASSGIIRVPVRPSSTARAASEKPCLSTGRAKMDGETGGAGGRWGSLPVRAVNADRDP
jgi:Sigma-70 factor, region 1.1